MKKIILSLILFSLSLTNAYSDDISEAHAKIRSHYKGNVKTVKTSSEKSVSIEYYNTEGWLTKVENIDKTCPGTPRIVKLVKFNNEGLPVEVIAEDGRTIYKLIYNDQNQFVRFEELIGGGNALISVNEYGPQGKLSSTISYDGNGVRNSIVEYVYGKNDSIIEKKAYNYLRKATRPTRLVRREFDNQNKLKYEFCYFYERGNDTDSLLKLKNSFNDKGLLAECVVYADGKLSNVVLTTTCKYDKFGNQTEENSARVDGLNNKWTRTYKCDKYGNPLVIKYDDKTSQKIEYEYYPLAEVKGTNGHKKIKGYGPTAQLEEEGKWEQSFKTLTELAAKNDKEAQLRLAIYYKLGVCTSADVYKAAQLYKSSAENGSASAQYSLARCYQLGTGVQKNADEAFKWFQKAADQGYEKAYYDLALMYGSYKKDEPGGNEKFVEYMKKSAITGFDPAIFVVKMANEVVAYEKRRESARLNQNTTSSSVATDSNLGDDDIITWKVEQKAEFVGGNKALAAFLADNIKYPKSAIDNKISGNVFVKFVVNKDGSLTDFEISRSVSPELDEEAIRVIKLMPNWKPARNRNKPVRSYFRLPIVFKLTE